MNSSYFHSLLAIAPLPIAHSQSSQAGQTRQDSDI